MNHPPQTILIVGGDAGIGLEVSKHILQLSKHAQIFVLGLHEASSITSERCTSFPGDVTRADYRTAAVEACISRHGKIDTLIYCAGVITPIERISNLDLDLVKRTFDVNLFSAIAMTQLCLPSLRTSRISNPLNAGHGKVLILSSACDSTITYHGWMPYCTSKAALSRFVACLAHEEPLLSVQGVYPKLTRTKMAQEVIGGEFSGVMADHEIERFRVWDRVGESMVEPPEWCGAAVAKLAVGLVEGGRSGGCAGWEVHVPGTVVGT